VYACLRQSAESAATLLLLVPRTGLACHLPQGALAFAQNEVTVGFATAACIVVQLGVVVDEACMPELRPAELDRMIEFAQNNIFTLCVTLQIVIVLLQLRVVADEACVPELRPAEMKRIAGDKAGAISGWMKQQLIKLGCSLTVKVRILGPAGLAAAVLALATRANAADGMRHGSRGM